MGFKRDPGSGIDQCSGLTDGRQKPTGHPIAVVSLGPRDAVCLSAVPGTMERNTGAAAYEPKRQLLG